MNEKQLNQDPNSIAQMADGFREQNGMNLKDNRKERRAKIRHFLKILAMYEKKKPTYNPNIEGEEEQYNQMIRIQQWSTSYGIVIRKLKELGYDFTKDKNRIRQQAAIAGEDAKRQIEETGRVQVGDMQFMPDPNNDSESKDMQSS